MAYRKKIKAAFNTGKKQDTAKKRKASNRGLKFSKKVTKGIGKFAQKEGVKAIKVGVKSKNKKLVKQGAKSVAEGTKLRAKSAGLRAAVKAGATTKRVYKMTAAHKKAISDALKGKKHKR